MARYCPNEAQTVAVAVSGGSDSWALFLLSLAWANHTGHEVVVFTVDHQLRPESTNEAQQVQMRVQRVQTVKNNVQHEILTWSPPPNMRLGHIERAARIARYELLIDACQKHKAPVLLLGHTQNDQIETVLMRLMQRSGSFGLAGMLPRRHIHSRVLSLRPLLSITRERLRDFLRERGETWIDDPSNEDLFFKRAALRKILSRVDPEIHRDVELAARFYTAHRQIKTREAQHFFKKHAAEVGEKILVITRKAFASLDMELRLYILRRAISGVGGAPYPPNEEALIKGAVRISSEENTRFTLGRTVIALSKETFSISREQRRSRPVALVPFSGRTSEVSVLENIFRDW